MLSLFSSLGDAFRPASDNDSDGSSLSVLGAIFPWNNRSSLLHPRSTSVEDISFGCDTYPLPPEIDHGSSVLPCSVLCTRVVAIRHDNAYRTNASPTGSRAHEISIDGRRWTLELWGCYRADGWVKHWQRWIWLAVTGEVWSVYRFFHSVESLHRRKRGDRAWGWAFGRCSWRIVSERLESERAKNSPRSTKASREVVLHYHPKNPLVLVWCGKSMPKRNDWDSRTNSRSRWWVRNWERNSDDDSRRLNDADDRTTMLA